MREKFIIEELDVSLTEDELRAHGQELAMAETGLDSLREEKKAVARNYRKKVDDEQAIVTRLSTDINRGAEKREVKCRITIIPATRVKQIIREDTGEIVREEAASDIEIEEATQTQMFNGQDAETEGTPVPVKRKPGRPKRAVTA